MKTQAWDRMLGFHSYFDIRHNQNNKVVSFKCWPYFIPQEIPWYSFLLQPEWNPGLLNVDRRNRSLENVQGPYPESNPEPPTLWQSDSTNCTTARPILFLTLYIIIRLYTLDYYCLLVLFHLSLEVSVLKMRGGSHLRVNEMQGSSLHSSFLLAIKFKIHSKIKLQVYVFKFS